MKKLTCLIFFFATIINQTPAQTFSPLGQGFDIASVRCIYPDTSNNLIYAGGSFFYSGNKRVNGIAVWDGTSWDSLAGGMTSVANVLSILKYNDSILACGTFSMMNSMNFLGSALWDGTTWHPFANASAGGYGFLGKAKILDGDLYFAGGFDSVNTLQSHKIAYYDGVNWTGFPPLDTSNGGFGFLDVIKFNNEVYVCGNFEGNFLPNTKDVAKFNGTNWTDVGGGLSGAFTGASSFAIFQGELYMAGGFGFPFSSDPFNNIMKWDGNTWSDVSGGVDATIFAMHVFNGELYVGGAFLNAGGGSVPAKHLAKWDGTQWHSIPGLVSIDNGIEALADMNGKLYIGGGFWNINGVPMNKITVYDPTTGVAVNPLLQNISVYPTLAKDFITIENNINLSLSISLKNIIGQSILSSFESNESIIKADISKLTNGVYMLNVLDGKNQMTKKIIINH